MMIHEPSRASSAKQIACAVTAIADMATAVTRLNETELTRAVRDGTYTQETIRSLRALFLLFGPLEHQVNEAAARLERTVDDLFPSPRVP